MHTNEPTEAEIRRECLKIQESWSEAERRRRAGTNHVGEADIPEFSVPELALCKQS